MAERLIKRRRSSRSTDSEDKAIKTEDPVLVVLDSEDEAPKTSTAQPVSKNYPCLSTTKTEESVINYE